MGSSHAKSTFNSYSSGQQNYLKFMESAGYATFPLNDVNLALWISSISHLAPSTVSVYISSVRSLVRSQGFTVPKKFPFLISSMISGLKRLDGPENERRVVP
eukprot:953425_1